MNAPRRVAAYRWVGKAERRGRKGSNPAKANWYETNQFLRGLMSIVEELGCLRQDLAKVTVAAIRLATIQDDPQAARALGWAEIGIFLCLLGRESHILRHLGAAHAGGPHCGGFIDEFSLRI